MTNPDDLARAASDAVDAWCAEHPGEWPASWVFERGRSGPLSISDFTAVTHRTVRDQALVIIAEDDVLQQCVADLVVAGASEDAARAAVATVVEYALTKGIIRAC